MHMCRKRNAAKSYTPGINLELVSDCCFCDVLMLYSLPLPISSFSGNTITLGARGDSYYEYLLKQWVQTELKEDKYKVCHSGSAVPLAMSFGLADGCWVCIACLAIHLTITSNPTDVSASNPTKPSSYSSSITPSLHRSTSVKLSDFSILLSLPSPSPH